MYGNTKSLASESVNVKTPSYKQTIKDIQKLMKYYNFITKKVIEFHAQFEKIILLQVGNARVGGMIEINEC